MTPVEDIDLDDLPLYAMHLLSLERATELGRQLQHNTEARRVLSEVYGELAVLALTVDGQSSPAQARTRLMKQVAREKRYVPTDRAPATGRTPRPISSAVQPSQPAGVFGVAKVLPWPGLLPWLGWAVAAGVALEAGHLSSQKQKLEHTVEAQQALAVSTTVDELSRRVVETMTSPAAKTVVLTPGQGTIPPQGRATYDADRGSLIFTASNLQPLSPTKIYELWLLPADGSAPVAAGTFHPDVHGNAAVLLPQIPRGTLAKGFGVTVEDGTGSPTPTLPIILKGAAV